jgi:hypothetical protein
MVPSMNFLIPKHVEQFSLERKYYKKYFYKIAFKVNEGLIKPGIPRIYNKFGNTQLYSAQQGLLSKIHTIIGADHECKIRTENRWISVFTNDETTIKNLFEHLSEFIVKFYSPVSEDHKNIIDQSKRIRVRKKLFEGIFKYKVYFSQDWKLRNDKYSEVKDWLYTLENIDNNRWEVNVTLDMYFNHIPGYKGYTAAIYLNDPEDLMMCQMKFHNEIHYIEEAVLLSDL